MLTFSAADSKHVDGKSKTTSEETPSKDKRKSDGKNKKLKLHRVLTLLFQILLRGVTKKREVKIKIVKGTK